MTTTTRDAYRARRNAEMYAAAPDGHGGVTLTPKRFLQTAIDQHYARLKFRDAPSFSRMRDLPLVPGPRRRKSVADEEQLPEAQRQRLGMAKPDPSVRDQREALGGRVLAGLDPPPPGMIYALQEQPNGTYVVGLIDDDFADLRESASDRRRVHRIADGPNPLLRRMNAVARRHYSRDRRTTDRESVMLRLGRLLPGERLELRPIDGDPDNGVEVVLLQNDTPNLIPNEGKYATGDSGQRRPSLGEMNKMASRFWTRK